MVYWLSKDTEMFLVNGFIKMISVQFIKKANLLSSLHYFPIILFNQI